MSCVVEIYHACLQKILAVTLMCYPFSSACVYVIHKYYLV